MALRRAHVGRGDDPLNAAEGVVVGLSECFFWSPDSSQIALLDSPTPEIPQVFNLFGIMADKLLWQVYTLASAQTKSVGRVFAASNRFTQYMTFFDQYSVSLSLWSRDGRFLVSTSNKQVLLHLANPSILEATAPQVIAFDGENANFSWF